MNKLAFYLVALSLAFVANNSFANQTPTLAEIEAEVANKAAIMDEEYGVLLSYQEQNDLKITIIAKAVAAQIEEAKANGQNLTTAQAIDAAMTKYKIEGSTQHRQLIIGVEATADMGGLSGNEPPQ